MLTEQEVCKLAEEICKRLDISIWEGYCSLEDLDGKALFHFQHCRAKTCWIPLTYELLEAPEELTAYLKRRFKQHEEFCDRPREDLPEKKEVAPSTKEVKTPRG